MRRKLKLKKLKKELEKLKENNSMSISKFLIRFFGIPIGKLKISHDDISILISDLEKINLDTILKNKNLIYNGEALLVIDSYGNVQCYITPEIKEYTESTINIKNSNKDSKFGNAVLSENLSRYELSILCRYYKDIKNRSKYNEVHDLLKIKKDEESVEKYKNKKLQLVMKGREEND